MKKFTEIEGFRRVVKHVKYHHENIGQLDNLPTLSFTGSVKLHGTNGGVRRSPSGKITTQSRQQIIDSSCDNAGFAAFIENIPDEDLNLLFDMVGTKDDDITIFGEWIGKGIQAGCAINELDKQWVVFGANVNETYVANNLTWELQQRNIFNIFQSGTFKIAIDFMHPELALEKLEEFTLKVEACCPYGKLFGKEGIGEGIVWVCNENPTDSDLFFKTKGTKHSGGLGKRKKEIATVDPQVVESIKECIDIVLTEERLKQGLSILTEQGLEIDQRNLGKYLKWIGQDVQKEELDTIEANGLTWKDVSKAVTSRAKAFFLNRLKEF